MKKTLLETLASSNRVHAELLSMGINEEQATNIAFAQPEQQIRMIDDLTLDNIILTAVLSGIAYANHASEGTALLSQHEAIENTKLVIKNMLI